jgi:hypothetical protein
LVLHLGNGYFADTNNIIGIFDLEKTTTVPTTRDFLKSETDNGNIIDVSEDLPKSFVVALEGTYLCDVAVSTLRGRLKEKL